MQFLDIRTLSFLAMASTLLLALAMQLSNRIARGNPAVRAWTWGAGLNVLGLALIGLRGMAPDFISIILANVLIAIGFVWFYFGLRLWLNLSRGPRWDIASALLIALPFLYFTYLDPSLAARIAIASLLFAAFDFASAYLLIFSPAARTDRSYRMLALLGVAGLVMGVIAVLRAVLTLAVPPTQDFMQLSEGIHKPYFLASILLNITLTFGLPYLVSSRTTANLRTSEERFRGLVEQAADGIFVGDARGNCIEANTSGARMLGYEPREILGMNLREVIVPEEVSRVREEAIKLAGGKIARSEWHFRRKDGSIFTGEMVSRELNGGGILTILRDISERKAAEAASQTLNTELALRTVELERSNKKLEAFSYSISHDLRAPLRAIHGFAAIIRDSAAEKLTDEERQYFDRIMSNANRMGELIDDILEFSRVSRAEMIISEVDMALLIRDELSDLRGQYPRAEVRVADMPRVQGDARLLRQVIQNLLSNALKFSSKRAQPLVEVGSDTGAKGEVRIWVRDNGAGFDPAYASRLFNVFERMHPKSDFPGTGVGLAIVKNVVERHNGRVWAESAPDQGATFNFSLPGPHLLGARPISPTTQRP